MFVFILICRLYLTTTLANPHYLPDIFLQVNVINFMVTFDGLQEQLLSAVVKKATSSAAVFM